MRVTFSIARACAPARSTPPTVNDPHTAARNPEVILSILSSNKFTLALLPPRACPTRARQCLAPTNDETFGRRVYKRGFALVYLTACAGCLHRDARTCSGIHVFLVAVKI